eukprot:1416394-Pleurochrysis_carterae.AAC.1
MAAGGTVILHTKRSQLACRDIGTQMRRASSHLSKPYELASPALPPLGSCLPDTPRACFTRPRAACLPSSGTFVTC